jgi:hypothetical protein
MTLEQLMEIIESNKFHWVDANKEIFFNKADKTIYKNNERWGANYKVSEDAESIGNYRLSTDLTLDSSYIINLAVLIQKNPNKVIFFNINKKITPQENQHWEIMDKEN